MKRIELITQEYVLRAMAKNYAPGNSWDHLDAEACTKAADEIASLRAELAGCQACRDKIDCISRGER